MIILHSTGLSSAYQRHFVYGYLTQLNKFQGLGNQMTWIPVTDNVRFSVHRLKVKVRLFRAERLMPNELIMTCRREKPVRGHPFMTSTRRGKGVRLRWTHVEGKGSSPMWTSTQKIKIRIH